MWGWVLNIAKHWAPGWLVAGATAAWHFFHCAGPSI